MFTLLITALLLSAQPPAAGDAETCLACHADAALSSTTADGQPWKLHVDASVLAGSVHAKLSCGDCHGGMTEVPHPSRAFRNARDVTVTYSETCRQCHFDKYAKTLDSVHQAAVARGDRTSPVCVDCHGAHDIRKAAVPRTRVSDTCTRCHEGVARAYTGSVHGRRLNTDAAGDVPVCTDCHRTHDIAGPHQEQWRLQMADMCGRCHQDPALMNKYGLSSAVLKTYLADFHGKTASLRQHQGRSSSGPVVARCVDCHGVHDIQKADSPGSPVMKSNLQKTCQKCHEGANPNFPDAWLSHYEPSLQRAPLVYGVKLAYAMIIPFMIGGLGLQILLHLWRLMVNR
ncbi:MAG TPA: cytochrome c3 family protein [Vicinamibacterales bacterium]|nr:cytochrome c3 family protein [Vicinamibacterales bacterium]